MVWKLETGFQQFNWLLE